MTPTSAGQDPGTPGPAQGPAPAGLIWTRPPKEKRERPTREAIVAAATDLADTHGLDAVSIRRVAAALQTRPTDLYRYFAMDERAMAAACRQVIKGLSEVVALLEGNVPGDDRTARRIALMQRFDVPPDRGPDREEASYAFRENGYEPRSSGGLVRRGLIERAGDRRYLPDKGRARLEELVSQVPAAG